MRSTPTNAQLEIEVAYLPKQLPPQLLTDSPSRIVDIYLSPENDLLAKLRLRQRGNQYEITKKVNFDPADLSLQDEYTIPLTEQEFKKLSKAGGREVIKDRYAVPLGAHIMEVDVFKGDLEGLVLLEVEFESQADRDAFVPPDYFGSEVTQEDFVAGAYLAGKKYADIQAEIKRLK